MPTNVVASGGLKFIPDLGHHQIDAFGRMSLGSYDHIALELNGNPLGLDSDDLVFEKSADTHTAAILANISGTPLCTIDVAGAFGRDLSAQGEAAMFDFAADWLANLYGAEIKNAIGRKHATRWNADPYALGAWSAAVPGSQFARRQFLDPIADNVWYAGEAAHETLWGTVGGAWESGERAADAVLRQLGPLKAAPAESRSRAGAQAATRARRTARALAARRTNILATRPASCGKNGSYSRSTPPVRLLTSPTIFAASASISASVMVLSRGWIVTAMAIDLRPGAMPLPS